MTYNWFQIFSLTEFVATGLISRTYSVVLEGIGNADFLVTKGNFVGVTYLDTFIPVALDDVNPYSISPYAVYLDDDENVWFGFEQ